MTSRRRTGGRVAAPAQPHADQLHVVLLQDVEGRGSRGEVVSADLDTAAELETAGAARRASAQDLSIAGIVPGC